MPQVRGRGRFHFRERCKVIEFGNGTSSVYLAPSLLGVLQGKVEFMSRKLCLLAIVIGLSLADHAFAQSGSRLFDFGSGTRSMPPYGGSPMYGGGPMYGGSPAYGGHGCGLMPQPMYGHPCQSFGTAYSAPSHCAPVAVQRSTSSARPVTSRSARMDDQWEVVTTTKPPTSRLIRPFVLEPPVPDSAR